MQAAARIQPSAETTQEPTVTYDAQNQTITATVIVSLPPGASNLVYATPLIGVPGPGALGPRWTVYWNLIAGAGLSSVSFPSTNGIVVPASGTNLPPNVENLNSERGPVDTEWLVLLKNTVTDVNVFNYDITATGVANTDAPQSFTTTTHDPSIVVTKDPIG